jgi:hypothetical protein
MHLDTNDPWPKLTQAVPCGQPHTAEVFYANNAYWPKNGTYPGSTAITNTGDEACNTAFQAYVGIPNNQSVYSWDNILPNASAWANGDRALHCVAYYSTKKHPSGEVLRATIRNTRK